MKTKISIQRLCLATGLVLCSSYGARAQDKLLPILKSELSREMSGFQKSKTPPYYLSLRVEDAEVDNIEANMGSLTENRTDHTRVLTPSVRLGSYDSDNYHNGQNQAISRGLLGGGLDVYNIPFDNNAIAIKQLIWSALNGRYNNAVHWLKTLRSGQGVNVASEDKSADFSKVKPEQYYEPVFTAAQKNFDKTFWAEKMIRYSAILGRDKNLIDGKAIIQYQKIRKYFLDTDGNEIVQNRLAARIMISAMTKADDGMELPLYLSYFSFSPDSLPGDAKIEKDVKEMVAKLNRLRVAPIVGPYTGPAILLGGASGVFFHEIFGHRVEGQRIKNDNDGQTFKKKIDQLVLPKVLSVYLDPTLKQLNGEDLNGYYVFDDQGVRGQRVNVVDHGIFKNFAMTRTPLEGFPRSNGHARAQSGSGLDVTSRQSNLLVQTSDYKTEQQLRDLLLKEVKAQGLEYGFIFGSVTNGFTMTGRTQPNAFNVSPIEVYKVYLDGRPDELVRGVDLIGTPLSMFSHIKYAGGKSEVFTGYCGAESGWVPVTAASPAIMVTQVEVQSKAKSKEQRPVLPSPSEIHP